MKLQLKPFTVVILSLMLGLPQCSQAQGLGGLVKKIGGAAKDVVGAVKAPVTAVAKTAGKVVSGGTNIATGAIDTVYQKAYSVASIAGKPGQFVFDAATFQQRFSNELASSAGNALGNTLQGQNPLQVVATPLAAGINAARERYYPGSQPIPADVKAGLAPYFPADVLNRARYAVGSVEITIPALIGGTQRFMGNDYAVTVNDIIVFNRQPPSFAGARGWWGHEVTHVKQYAQMGVNQFAYEYMRTAGNTLEGEARSMESRVGGAPVSSAGTGAAASGETITAQVVMQYSPAVSIPPGQLIPPLRVLVTSSARIIATDVSGQTVQIGWSLTPRIAGSVWTLQTQRFVYDVAADGRVFWLNPATGLQYVVGQVYRM